MISLLKRSAFVPFTLAVLIIGATGDVAAQEGRNVALVIGNGNYTDLGRLSNPPNDARDMAAALRGIGFEVDTVIDGSLRQMEQAVVRLGDRLSSGADTTGFFFYAGHGVQSDGSNYLIPAGASIPSEDFLSERALSAQVVLNIMQRAGNSLNVVVLDACRDNPFSWSRSGTRGLSAISSQPPGSIVAYATSAGSVAQDGTGRNGVFTAELLKHITKPGIDVDEVFDLTARGVMETTNNRQIPAVYKQFFGSAFLAGSSGGSRSSSSTQPARTPGFTVERTFGSIRVSVATAGTVYLDGTRMGAIGAGQTATLSDVEAGSRRVEVRYANGERERFTVTVRTGSTAAASFSYIERPDIARALRNEVLIQGGTFQMGSASGGFDDERPVHTVRLDSFFMMATEVTFSDYDAFAHATGRNRPDDEGWGRGTRPVINVRWYDAVAYANWLSEWDGLTPVYRINGTSVTWNQRADGWRLPTEAEWEYAARGGHRARNTRYAGSGTAGAVAWYDGNAGGQTHPVGQKQANEAGLYDMSGNVWEWCWDWYGSYRSGTRTNPTGPASGQFRVLRGGSWNSSATGARVALRDYNDPGSGGSNNGFRLVRMSS